MRLCVRNERKRLQLATRSTRCGNRDHRQHRRGGFSDARVVVHRAATANNKVDPFGAVHRTSTAQTNQKLRLKFPSHRHATIHVIGGRVFSGSIENPNLQLLSLNRLHGSIDVARSDNSRIGHQQHAARCQLRRKLANTPQRTLARDNSRPHIKIKWLHNAKRIKQKGTGECGRGGYSFTLRQQLCSQPLDRPESDTRSQ